MIKKHKLVSIEWVDSQFAAPGWCYIDDLPLSIATVTTVGFLINQTKDIITVASSLIFKDDLATQTSCAINIPKCCIKSKKVISF